MSISTNHRASSGVGVTYTAKQKSKWRQLLEHPLANYYLIAASVALLVFLGVLMVLSSSSVFAAHHTDSSYYYLWRQIMFLAIGVPAVWFLATRSEKFLRFVAWPAIILSILLLLAVWTPLGVERFDTRAWLNLGFTEIQPSELAKAALILWSAAVLANRRKTLDQPLRLLVPLLPVQAVILGLVVLQKDLGTAVIVIAIIFSMLFFVGAPMRILVGLGVPVVGFLALMIAFAPHRLERVIGFVTGQGMSSDQPLNAIYALATGGWWGVGLGGSRQKWGGLYNGAQTDYVFAVLGEEMGLLGSIVVIGLFAVLGYAGFRVARFSTSPFLRLASAGMTAWLMIQAVVNLMVVMRMAPVIGVPLPFISYGGSALLANLIAIGVLLAAARLEPKAAKALAQSKQHRTRVTGVVDARTKR